MATKKKTSDYARALAAQGSGTVVSSNKSTQSNNKSNTSNSTTNYAGTNYQADINAAVAKGDYVTAAKLEQQRNEKIDATGSNYAKTNNYSSYLGGVGLANQGVNKAVSNSNTNNSPYTTTNYTPTGTFNDAIITGSDKDKLLSYQQGYTNAMAVGNEDLAKWYHDQAQALRATYGYSGGDDGSEYNLLPQENKVYEYDEPQPTAPQQDPRIEALLNEILNREDFKLTYDVASDPLYQQYASMYQREGDRAMRDTMAEAAASAGGMNSYAMTAAQQANNYYGSQLNDKIPELYELAYQMYLGEKESKVQDLGLLQQLDESQYNRYRDTMNDWYADRNFAYGVYRDNVGDQQWQDSFNYNAFVNDRDFAYTSDWANKQWDYNVSKDEKETAKNDVWELIKAGVPPSAELLAKAGYSDADNKYNGGDSGNYATVSSDVAAMVGRDDKTGAMTYLQEALNAGYITWSECVGLISKYGL